MEIKIGNKIINEINPVFVIAEAGINHNGDLNIAKDLIKKAKEIGADCIKFQSFITEELLTKDTLSTKHIDQATGKEETVYDVIKRTELSQEVYKELKEFADNEDIIFLSSAIDVPSLKTLVNIGVDAIKIASCDLTNLPLLKEIGKTGLPVIMSTGLGNIEEIEEAIKTIKEQGNDKIVLLHCIALYPPAYSDLNLKAITSLKDEFGLIVGFSDHTSDDLASVAAVARGAKVIEKHFTLDQNMPGPDQKASMEPDPFKVMINKIRNVEQALGDGVKKPGDNEQGMLVPFRRSLVARQDIEAGAIITEDLVAIKRPGDGMKPGEIASILGKKTKISIKQDEKFSLDNLE